MIVIGDVHGCYKTLCALLDKLPDDKITFAGDLMDRGPGSKQVVDLVMEKGYQCVLGNHEHMFLDFCGRNNYYDETARGKKEGPFVLNGGANTLLSYYKTQEEIAAFVNVDETYEAVQEMYTDYDLPYEVEKLVPKEHIDWVDSLPLYITFEDVFDDRGRLLFVSHSSVKPYGPITKYDLDAVTDLEVKPMRRHRAYTDDTIIWHRCKRPAILENRFHIFGHTPERNVMARDHYVNVDSGCVYGKIYGGDDYGQLTAFQYPEMKMFQQKNLD